MLIEGKTPEQVAESWYGVDEIHRSLREPRWHGELPRDTHSYAFSEWLTTQYRLAMAKGIQLGMEATVEEGYVACEKIAREEADGLRRRASHSRTPDTEERLTLLANEYLAMATRIAIRRRQANNARGSET